MQPNIWTALVLNAAWWAGVALVFCPVLRIRDLSGQILACAVIGVTILLVALEVLSCLVQMNVTYAWTATVLLLACGLVLAGIRRRNHHAARLYHGNGAPKLLVADPESNDPAPANWLGAMPMLGFVTWAAVYFLLRGLLVPVEPVSDAPIYHLYFAVRWWQAGWIEPVPTPFGELAATYFPANADLWYTWLVLGSGGITLAKVGQWPFLLIAATAIYRLARQIGADRAAATLPAAVWITTPWALLYAPVAIADLVFAAWYSIATSFLADLKQAIGDGQPVRQPILLFALAAGLALGTKSIGLVFVPLLLLIALWIVCRRARCVGDLIVLGFGLFVPSGFWFARNWWMTGNPIYPLHVEWFGLPLLDGWYDREIMLRSGYHQPTTDIIALAGQLGRTLDFRIAWLWPLSVAYGLFVAWRRRESLGRFLTGNHCPQRSTDSVRWAVKRRPERVSEDIHAGQLAGLAVIHLVVFWWVIPYNTQERFLLAALAMGIVPLARFLSGRPRLQILLAVLAAWHLLAPPWARPSSGVLLDLSLAGNVVSLGSPWHTVALPVSILAAGTVLLAWRRWWRWAVAIAVVAVGAATSAWPGVQFLRANSLLGFYPGVYPPRRFGQQLLPTWLGLERTGGKHGATVAYSGTNLPLYLFGKELRIRVRYVNVSGSPHWLAHDFHLQRLAGRERDLADTPWPDWHRASPDYQRWLTNLREYNVQYLFVARENLHGQLRPDDGPAPFPVEYEWAEAHPEVFTPILDSAGFLPDGQLFSMLYRVRPAGGPTTR